MEAQKTLETLRALADGIDPSTGERFPVGSAYQHPDTVRSLFSAISLIEAGDKKLDPTPTAKRTLPGHAGRPWSEEEDARLGKSYDAGKSIAELGDVHQRSKWAVESRLARLGKIPLPPSRFPAKA